MIRRPSKLFVFVVVILLLALACSKDKATNGSFSTRGFYYWKTTPRGFSWHDSTYQAMNIGKLYVRAFDVDWNEETHAPVPVSPLGYSGSFYNDSVDVVPVVFITNETFRQLDRDQSITLARQVHRKLKHAAAAMLSSSGFSKWYYFGNSWQQDPYRIHSRKLNAQQAHDSIYAASMARLHEVQFDCDWTKSTKDKYFAFLEESRKLFAQQKVSSTVRLYQYKYPKDAGVPPVTRGMLMCYNAGDVKDPKSVNAIFDKAEVMSYLKSGDYPVPLDYALPMFDWVLLYRNGKLMNILSMNMLEESEYSRHTTALDPTHLQVTDDFVYGQFYGDAMFIRKGDQIRVEKPDMKDVADVAQWLSDHKNNPQAVLTFYHLNDYDFQEHSKAIEGIFNSF